MTQEEINEILSSDNLKIMFLISELRANEDLVDALNHFFIEKNGWPLNSCYVIMNDIPGLFKSNMKGGIVPNRKLRKYEINALKAVLYNKNKYWKMFMEIKEGIK
jgi:hypothetical protein